MSEACMYTCTRENGHHRQRSQGERRLCSGREGPSVGGSPWAEEYTLIRRGLHTLYLSSTFLLRRFPHLTDVISFVISIVLQRNYRVGMKHG